jgi:porphyrinogen peroxidase
MGAIKNAIKNLRVGAAAAGANLVVGFGPGLLPELTTEVPADFNSYPGYEAPDGAVAKATQEEMLVWINHSDKGTVWKLQYDMRNELEGHMMLKRETPTFIYDDSLDMTGFQDGAGNPDAGRDTEVACVPEGQPGAGGSHIIAQRWIHDLKGFHAQSIPEQEGVFGRTKGVAPEGAIKLEVQPDHSHIAHVDLRVGKTGDSAAPKRNEITRRSTPYAFPAPPTGGDGVVGLYFIGFCAEQAPLDERMRAMYGMDGQVRDKLTEFSTPASGAFYFAPSVEVLDAL